MECKNYPNCDTEFDKLVEQLRAELAEAKAYNSTRTDELLAATRRIAELEEQRDELAKAAKVFRTYGSVSVTDAEGYAEAVAALAKVKT